MNITLFGIPNCNTMKKARDWLTEHDIAYHFHAYKKEGIDVATLEAWSDVVDWQVLLNKRGTTWRKLSDEDKTDISKSKAIALMVANPSMIKRPVLQQHDGENMHITVGFSADSYAQCFANHQTEA